MNTETKKQAKVHFKKGGYETLFVNKKETPEFFTKKDLALNSVGGKLDQIKTLLRADFIGGKEVVEPKKVVAKKVVAKKVVAKKVVAKKVVAKKVVAKEVVEPKKEAE